MSPADTPLLSDADLKDLYQRACSRTTASAQSLLQQSSSGDIASRYLGTGLDYEESRPYHPGDDPRFINWRLSARSGETQIKRFRETRRPDLFILLDRRSAMRFGTRRRLKVTQAARTAALLAFAADQQGWAVSGLMLDTTDSWFPASAESGAIWHWVKQAATACPPHKAATERSLRDVLPLLPERLLQGCHVYILSDFSDFSEASERDLMQLSRRHPVFAVHVLDAAEWDLPAAGQVMMEAAVAGARQWVNLDDAAMRQTFRQTAASFHEATQQRLKRCGCEYLLLGGEVESPELQVPMPHGFGT